jgi:serine/threonine-protein kinase
MGTVFLAERVEGQFEQYVAIKLLRGFPTSESMRRLRQERQILAALDHPNIARLLDGGETDDGQPWLAMEYVAGLPLLEFVRLHAPSMRERLALIDAMLDAIEHAHQHLIIHRDLKPANVLVTDAGTVKLLDFGIADRVGDSVPLTRSAGYDPGKRAAPSPPPATSSRICPRRGRGAADASITPLRLDADMAGIIAKATSARPEDRYTAIGELRDDLDRYRDGRPVRATAMTRRYRLRKFVGRHRIGALLSVAAMLVLALFVWRLDRERERAVLAESSAQLALAASERDAASARASLEFLTDALSAASPDAAMSTQVRVRDLLDAARRKLEARDRSDGSFTQRMQRLLGSLYSQLGEIRIARDLLHDGLAGVVPTDSVDALRLANDYEDYSMVLGMLEEGDEALAAAQNAARWREQYAPNDKVLSVRSLQMLAMVVHRAGKDEEAIDMLRQAYRLGIDEAIADIDIRLESAQLLASLLATRGDCEEALQVADDGLALAGGELPADAPAKLPLMRARALALNACGRYADAEAVFRAAIALQERVTGGGGSRMMALTNDLALTLNELGRYQEAAEMLSRADKAVADFGKSARRFPGESGGYPRERR